MELSEGEKILAVYHHHPTPFAFMILKVIGVSFPFYLVLFLFQEILTTGQYLLVHILVIFGFSLVFVYVSMIYWLDRLVVTNLRVVHIDWKLLTLRDETEAFLQDIQDVKTEEKGVLAFFRLLDYGMIKVETASSHVTIIFEFAPNPERIRRYIYHVRNQ